MRGVTKRTSAWKPLPRWTDGAENFTSHTRESELTGLEGTKTTVKLDGKTVALIRTGTFPSHMLFAEDERHVGLYQTPVGSEMAIATHTSRVHNTIGEDGGHLIIDYTVEVDNSLMGEHHFEMTVSTKPNIQVV